MGGEDFAIWRIWCNFTGVIHLIGFILHIHFLSGLYFMKKLYILSAAALLGAASMGAAVVRPAAAKAGVPRSWQNARIESLLAEKAPRKAARAGEAETEPAAPALTWKSVGTGMWRDDVLTSIGMWEETWEVDLEECNETPGYYRAINPYGNGKHWLFMGKVFDCADIYFHCEEPNFVYIDAAELKGIKVEGEDAAGNVQSSRVSLYDIGGYYYRAMQDYGMGMEDIVQMGIPFGRFADGHVTFVTGALGLEFLDFEGEAIEANSSGRFRLSFPGAKDYEISLATDEICSSTPAYTATYTVGTDATGVKYAALPGRPSAEELLAAVEASEATTAGEFNVTLSWGINTIMAAAVKADGTLGETTTTMVYGMWDDAENWKSIGMATYSDGIIPDAWGQGFSTQPYSVPVEENVNTPGLYRLINPYGSNWPKLEAFRNDPDGVVLDHGHNHYLLIDATNPARVMIPASPVGLQTAFTGPAQIYSNCWDYINNNGASPDSPQVEAEYGTLANNKITFPGGAITFYEAGYGATRANINHNFSITLPSQGENGIDTLTPSAAAAPAEYFRLDGTSVAAPTAPGLYLRRQGNTVEKHLVK